MFAPVKTPCIGICSTALGDDVCRGCKRFAHEVTGWNGYSIEQRRLIIDRLDQFLVRIMSHKIDILDCRRLRESLRLQQITVDASRAPQYWLYLLLKAGAGQIDRPEAFGFRISLSCRQRDLAALREEIDQQLYELSCAHFQRYLLPGLARDSGCSDDRDRGDIKNRKTL